MATNVYNSKGASSGKCLSLPQTSVSLSQKPQLLALSCDLFLKFWTMHLLQMEIPSPSSSLHIHAAAAAKSLQSCPTLCNPIDGSSPGTPVPGILQARTLEWVAFPSPMNESEK